MRGASQAFVLCTVLSAAGVFMPAVELRVGLVGSALLGKRSALSLYTANTKRDVVKNMIAAYHRAPSKGLGVAIAGGLMPKVGKRVGSYLGDARDAMATLDEVSDADVGSAATILNITLWALLAMHLVMGGIVVNEIRRRSDRRGRIAVALVLAVFVTAIEVTIHLGCREAVAVANDEVGKSVLRLGVGAYLMPLAAVASLGSAVMWLVQLRRERANPTP